MTKYVFRFYEWKVIRRLLLEIGQYEYDANLERLGYAEHKPFNKDFYLETSIDCILLCYRYPSGHRVKIMKVDNYDNLPKDGWQLMKDN